MKFRKNSKPPNTADPKSLREQLATRREIAGVYSDDDLAVREDAVRREIAVGDVEVLRVAARERRQQQLLTARDKAALSRMHRDAVVRGTAARIRAAMATSGEVRALRITAVSRWSLWIGIPVFVALGLYSTAKVQEGLAWLLSLKNGSLTWYAAFLLEPAIVVMVAGVILAASVLRRNGGYVDHRLQTAERAGLGTSIVLAGLSVLNHADQWTASLDGVVAALGAVFAAVLGTIGCAFVAWLVGVIDEHVAAARPWHGAPSITDLDLALPDLDKVVDPFWVNTSYDDQHDDGDQDDGDQDDDVDELDQADVDVDASRGLPAEDRPIDLVPTEQAPAEPVPSLVPDTIPEWMTSEATGGGIATLEPRRPAAPEVHRDNRGEVHRDNRGEVHRDVHRAGSGEVHRPADVRGGEPQRSKGDRGKAASPQPRRDKGRRVPPSARRAGSPARTIDELAAELDRLIKAGELTEDSSVNLVRQRLECSPKRAKAAIEVRQSQRGRNE